MNIFKVEKYNWWKHMECIMENVNLKDISIVRNNHIIFNFLNSYNGDFYKKLICKKILKCCIDNEAFENEDFSCFITDIYVKKLSEEEIKNSLKYYRYGYNVNFSQVNKLYLILIIDNEIYLDIICESFEINKNDIFNTCEEVECLGNDTDEFRMKNLG